MSIHAIDLVWRYSGAAKASDLLICLAIADYSNEKGLAWPSIPTLAKKVRLGPRQVKRALARLEALGELKVLKKQGPHGVNTYMINLVSPKTPSKGAKVTSKTGGSVLQVTTMVSPKTPNPSSEPLENLGEKVAAQKGLTPMQKTVLAIFEKNQSAGLVK